MIDYFSLAISHGLIALAAFRLLLRDDLDCDPVADSPEDVAEAQSRVP